MIQWRAPMLLLLLLSVPSLGSSSSSREQGCDMAVGCGLSRRLPIIMCGMMCGRPFTVGQRLNWLLYLLLLLLLLKWRLLLLLLYLLFLKAGSTAAPIPHLHCERDAAATIREVIQQLVCCSCCAQPL